MAGSSYTLTCQGTAGFGSDVFTGPSAAFLDDCCVGFMNAIAGKMTSDVSLVNFIIELKDLKHTFSFLKERWDRLISGGGLSYSYAIRPLISDMHALLNSWTKITRKLEYLRNNSGKPVRVQFRKSTKVTDNDAPWPGPTAGFQLHTENGEFVHSFTGSAIVTYDVSSLTDFQAILKLSASYFGVDNPAAIVWEAIPYSFLADYVSNVGRVLGSYSLEASSIPHIVHSVSYSVKTVGNRKYYLCFNTRSSNPRLLGTEQIIAYDRCLGLPVRQPALELVSPSVRSLVLTSLLTHQKLT